MTPRSFDVQTCREMLADQVARTIEAKARHDADYGEVAYSPPYADEPGTYWSVCQQVFAAIVYHEQFHKRLERNKRKQG